MHAYSLSLLFSVLGERCSSVVSVHSWCDGSLDQSFMVNPLSYFLFCDFVHKYLSRLLLLLLSLLIIIIIIIIICFTIIIFQSVIWVVYNKLTSFTNS